MEEPRAYRTIEDGDRVVKVFTSLSPHFANPPGAFVRGDTTYRFAADELVDAAPAPGRRVFDRFAPEHRGRWVLYVPAESP